MVLKQKIDEITRDLNKSNFPTKRVAEQSEIGLAQMAELKRMIKLAGKILGNVSCDDPALGKVVKLLERLEAGVQQTSAGHQHELDAAKVVDENGIAVLLAIEGKTSVSTGFDVRRNWMLKEITKTKVDAATLAAANKAGGEGRGGGGARGGRGRGGRGGGRGGGGGGGGGKPPLTDAQKARLKCYSCQGTGHLSNNCPNPKNA
jgi:uncharacterized membrane protein YgcG